MFSFCYPVISFLHVPGKMSQPLWLMMGTAFHIQPPSFDDLPATTTTAALEVIQSRHWFLTAKHTFAPWDHTADAEKMKIPTDFRKQRYVVCRLYMHNNTHRAIRDQHFQASLVASHPTLDVALLSIPRSTIPIAATSSTTASATPAAGAGQPGPTSSLSLTSPLALSDAAMERGSAGTFYGFRGEGMLGELNTFDSELLKKLTPQENEKLLNELKDVEGKQVSTRCDVTIESSDGAASCVGDGRCFHGMSGCPLICGEKCGGILYGKHPDYPKECIGYVPSEKFFAWVRSAIAKAPI